MVIVGLFTFAKREIPYWDWSSITGRWGLQNGKIAGPKLFAPPPSLPQDRVTLFAPPPPPLLKSQNFLHPPPFNMAQNSSYCVKTSPELFVPPPPSFDMAKTLSTPFHRGKTSHAPPPPLSRFVAPPPPRN